MLTPAQHRDPAALPRLLLTLLALALLWPGLQLSELNLTVLVAPEFIAFAKENLVLMELDFPNNKPQSAELKAANQKLAQRFKVEGYPTVIVLDANGKELFREVGYGGTPAKAYVAKLAKLKK